MISSHICDSSCMETKLRNQVTIKCFGCDQNFNTKCFHISPSIGKSTISPDSNVIFVCGKCHVLLSKHKQSLTTRKSINQTISSNAKDSVSNKNVLMVAAPPQQALDVVELKKTTEANTELLRTILSHITQSSMTVNYQRDDSRDMESTITTSLETISSKFNDLKASVESIVFKNSANQMHVETSNSTTNSGDAFDIYRRFEKLNWESIDILNKKIDNLKNIDNGKSDIMNFLDSCVNDLHEKLNYINSNIVTLNGKISPSEYSDSEANLTQLLRERFNNLIDVNDDVNEASNSKTDYPIINELLTVLPPTNITKSLNDNTKASRESKTHRSLLNEQEELDQEIYVAKFQISTTCEDVREYISHQMSINTTNLENLKIHRLTKKNQDISKLSFISFKIETDKEIADQLLKPEFWPNHVSVKSHSRLPTALAELSPLKIPSQNQQSNKKKILSIFHENMRSVVNIRKNLLLSTNDAWYDIITITETWLKSFHMDNEFMSDKYNIFRKDRLASSIENDRGGGVLIAVKKEIDCEEYFIPEMEKLEAICVRIRLDGGCLFVYCLYIQPNNETKIYEDHIRAMTKLEINDKDNLLIAGDFNLPIVRWVDNEESSDYIPLVGQSESDEANIARFVTDSMIQLGLYQMNNIQNISGNVLDLIYTNVPELTISEKSTLRLIPEELSDKAHNPLSISIECNPTIFPMDENPFAAYCFRKADFQAIREYLDNFDYEHLYRIGDINTMLDEYYTLLYNVFEQFVPKATIKPSRNPTWFNKKLCNMKNVRNRQYSKLCASRKHNKNADSSVYDKVNENYEKMKEETYNKFVHTIAMNSKKNPSKFWKFINGKRKSNSLPCKMTLNEKEATSDIEKANLFAEFFASVFIERPEDNELVNFINERNDDGCFDVQITSEIVETTLRSMDLSKGQGPDSIPPIFLRECAPSLSGPLNVIYNRSLVEAIYPERFKLSQLTPIYKEGKKTDISNYRGTAVMPNLAKVFERIVHTQLKMIINPEITKKQHGFVNSRNIETNLMEFCTFTHLGFEQGAQVDTFYSDVRKAFDTVEQPKSIRKLAHFPIGNQTLRWLNSYSSKRKHRVRIGTALSDEFTAHSAIGQGTILGPTIFITFFNDSDGIRGEGKSFNFADDKKKAMIVKSIADTVKLQEEIDKFVQWCDDNGLELNVNKCKIMTFTHKLKPIITTYYIKGIPIERVEETTDLGVKMDPKLSFGVHREFAKKKADYCLSFIKRECYKSLSMDNAKLLYGTLVRSHLEYANVVWSPSAVSHKSFIESTQKQAVIFIHKDNINRSENDYVLQPYKERCEELKLTSLNRRRVNSTVLWIHKLLSGRIDCPDLRNQLHLNTGTQTLRNPNFIKIKFSRTGYGHNAPLNNACRAFNYAVALVDPTLPYNRFKSDILRLPDSVFKDLIEL